MASTSPGFGGGGAMRADGREWASVRGSVDFAGEGMVAPEAGRAPARGGAEQEVCEGVSEGGAG